MVKRRGENSCQNKISELQKSLKRVEIVKFMKYTKNKMNKVIRAKSKVHKELYRNLIQNKENMSCINYEIKGVLLSRYFEKRRGD